MNKYLQPTKDELFNTNSPDITEVLPLTDEEMQFVGGGEAVVNRI